MSKDIYESPLSSRYASPYMLHLFSPDMRFQTWRRLWVELARVNGEEFSPTSSHGSTHEQDENGNVRGSAYTGSFDRIVDPAQVEAIRVGGVWLELATFTLS